MTGKWITSRERNHTISFSRQKALQHYLSLSVVRTPKQCLEKLEYIQQRIGTDHFLFGFSRGGLPLSKAERSMRLKKSCRV